MISIEYKDQVRVHSVHFMSDLLINHVYIKIMMIFMINPIYYNRKPTIKEEEQEKKNDDSSSSTTSSDEDEESKPVLARKEPEKCSF